MNQIFLLSQLFIACLINPLIALENLQENTEPTINKWVGRLGNCMFQIIHMLSKTKNKKATVYIPSHDKHPFLSEIVNKTYPFGPNYLKPGTYFFSGCACNFYALETIIPVIQKEIIPRFQFASIDRKLFQNSIVIHIRNGDIWNKKTRSLKHLQPPLEYYKAILNRHKNCHKIIIVQDPLGYPSPLFKPLENYIEKLH